MIRQMETREHALCDRILRGLPDWFGIEEAIVNYVRDLQNMETWIAEADGECVGFSAINQHNEYSAEIHVMAVAEEYHRQGIGRQLVEHSEATLLSRSVEFLQVKTLSPSRPNTHFERTRRFYERMGFRPLEENLLWGERNPCLIMVKHLSS
ncbi:MAG TPA: GNAT family N-acetyltransferase [Candidatus Latescibacteria bacterium]|nr:GNAT family N-acetyltransferase [Candidatus Latescibacterota bacterium]